MSEVTVEYGAQGGVRHWRQRPVVIEAMQVLHGAEQAVIDWINNHGGIGDWAPYSSAQVAIVVGTIFGYQRAVVGDYVIRGVDGSFMPCRPDVFKALYEEVE